MNLHSKLSLLRMLTYRKGLHTVKGYLPSTIMALGSVRRGLVGVSSSRGLCSCAPASWKILRQASSIQSAPGSGESAPSNLEHLSPACEALGTSGRDFPLRHR